jgi:hypothetical protein
MRRIITGIGLAIVCTLGPLACAGPIVREPAPTTAGAGGAVVNPGAPGEVGGGAAEEQIGPGSASDPSSPQYGTTYDSQPRVVVPYTPPPRQYPAYPAPEEPQIRMQPGPEAHPPGR